MNSLPHLKPSSWPGDGEASRLREAYRSVFDDVTGGDCRMVAALTHVLAHPGHLGRAMTCLATGRAIGLEHNRTFKLALGVELLHTASLIFDDLPCMDNATERRHAACVHTVHGESIAMLAALAFINRAYALLWEGLAAGSLEDRLRAGEYLDDALGVFGLVGGQSRDLNDFESRQSASGVRQVAAMKTVPLLKVAIILPVIISGGSLALVRRLERYCLFRGLAFQVADDLKDLMEGSKNSGKTTNRDATLGRPNLALANGKIAAVEELLRLNRLGDKALRALPGAARQWGFLDRLRPEIPGVTTAASTLPEPGMMLIAQ